MRKSTFWIKFLALVFLYFVAGRAGLRINSVSTFAALVWPPSGLALAALLLLGFEFWPAVFVGAFFLNFSIGAGFVGSFGVALGNMLEASMAFLILHKIGFQKSLDNLRSALAITIPAALGTTMISASVGVVTLYLVGQVRYEEVSQTWLVWWLGDGMGILLVTPMILIWSKLPELKWVPIRFFEGVVILAGTALVIVTVFTNWVIEGSQFFFPRPFYVFPVMSILAARLGPRAVATANFIIAMLIIYETSNGRGRFITADFNTNLLQAQFFVGILSVTTIMLAATVAERKKLYTEAQNAIQMRDEFLSVVSHELRNPLATLSLRLQLFQQSLDKGTHLHQETVTLPLQTTRGFALCQEQVQRLISSLNSLLDLSRIRFDQLTIRKEYFDLRELVRDVAEFMRVEATEKGASLIVETNEPIIGNWDRVRLEQVVTNLISNAIKYGESKPISVTLERDLIQQQAILRVKDEGPGIGPENLDKIFNRFERGKANAGKTSGLGLGLYICRQIILAHRGNIGVSSVPGKGTVFTVSLPLAES